MKTRLLFSLLFCMLVQPFCALSEVSDETLKADVAVMKTDIAVMKTELTHLKATVNDRFDNIQKSFDRQNNIISAVSAFLQGYGRFRGLNAKNFTHP